MRDPAPAFTTGARNGKILSLSGQIDTSAGGCLGPRSSPGGVHEVMAWNGGHVAVCCLG